MMFQCSVFRGKVFRTMKDIYININKVAEAKGLKSTRSIRMAINSGKYQARTIPVNGGFSYEILYSSLEIEIQEKLEDEEIKSTALVGYEIMMTENTQCIASALRDSILNLGLIPILLEMRKWGEVWEWCLLNA